MKPPLSQTRHVASHFPKQSFAYSGSRPQAREIGDVYRQVLGRECRVAMPAVQVAALIEDRAKVEIVVTAVKPMV
jgi:hypothetical protein